MAKGGTMKSDAWGEKEPCVYIMASKPNGVLYVGVTSGLRDRVYIHKQDLISGFTSKYRVHRLVYYEMHASLDVAFKRETRLKKWKRTSTRRPVASCPDLPMFSAAVT